MFSAIGKFWSRKGAQHLSSALIFKLENQRPREVKGLDKDHTACQKQEVEGPLQGSFKAKIDLP